MVEAVSRNLKPTSTNLDSVSKGRNIVMVIGIDDYNKWPKLHNAVNDAIGIHKLFVEKLGFTSPIPPLLNSDATQKNLTSLVLDQLHKVLEPDDALLIFFAGHGHTRENKLPGKTSVTGYIIPVEAQIDHWGDYIKIDSFLEDISNLPARHILVVLDACHSGFALGNAMKTFRDGVSYEQALLNNVSRKIITSARRDEIALDGGPIEGHSLFTGTLIDGLNWGKADLDGNDFVTSSELGLFLQQQVGQASESKQRPDFGSFHQDDRGEMVISLRDDTFDVIKARAFTALQQGDMAQFKELVVKAVDLRPQSPEALYLQYRLHFSNGNLDDAVMKLNQLKILDLSKCVIPLSKRDLEELEAQLKLWRSELLIPTGDFPLEVTMLTGSSDKESLAEAPQNLEGEHQEYLIEYGAVIRFNVKNLTPNPAHLYYITIRPSGRLSIGPLLEDDEPRFDGLKPEKESQGPLILVKAAPGLYETRLFYSPKRVSSMLFPLSMAAPSYFPISKATLTIGTPLDSQIIQNFMPIVMKGNGTEPMRMKPVWYRIIEKKVIK